MHGSAERRRKVSEEKPVQFRRRPSNEPSFGWSWKVTREESATGPIVVLELINREDEDEDDAARLGLEPAMARELGNPY
jgi:hypothetical protein